MGNRIVPRGRLGRPAVLDPRLDHAARRVGDRATSGGPNFPDDAADIGPAVAAARRLRRGVRVPRLRRLRRASSSSRSTRARTARSPTQEIRTALDNAGLQAAGTHTGGLAGDADPVHGAANRQAQIDLAGILGYRMVGTAGNPANPTLGTLAAWQEYAEQANTVGAAFRAAGIKYFFHPEQDWFRFFADPAHPELDRVHRIDWFTDNTDPQARVLRAGHDAHARRPRALPRPRRRAAVRRQRLVRPARRRRPADRLARQGRRPRHPAAGAGRQPVHADARAAGLPAQRRHRRRLRRRGLDRPRLPGRPRPRGDRLPGPVRPLRAQQPGLVPRRERQRPGTGCHSTPAGRCAGPR